RETPTARTSRPATVPPATRARVDRWLVSTTARITNAAAASVAWPDGKDQPETESNRSATGGLGRWIQSLNPSYRRIAPPTASATAETGRQLRLRTDTRVPTESASGTSTQLEPRKVIAVMTASTALARWSTANRSTRGSSIAASSLAITSCVTPANTQPQRAPPTTATESANPLGELGSNR